MSKYQLKKVVVLNSTKQTVSLIKVLRVILLGIKLYNSKIVVITKRYKMHQRDR